MSPLSSVIVEYGHNLQGCALS